MKFIKIFLICLGLEIIFISPSWSWIVDYTPPANSYLRLRSIKMEDMNTGWAVGDRETIFQCAAGVWAEFSSNSTGAYLLSIDMLSDGSDGWIVGTNGTILRWDNAVTQWNVVSSGTTETLWSVHIVAVDNVYVVGNNCTILRWDGSSWTDISPSLSEAAMKKSLLSVYMVDANNGWAVGSEGIILQCSGGTWSEAISPTNKILWSVFMFDSDNGWAVGDDDAILRYQGSWADYGAVSSDATLLEVKILSATDGWIVGGRCQAECEETENPECTLLHWGGANWIPVSAPNQKPARSVSIVDAANVFAVGNDGLIIKGP